MSVLRQVCSWTVLGLWQNYTLQIKSLGLEMFLIFWKTFILLTNYLIKQCYETQGENDQLKCSIMKQFF